MSLLAPETLARLRSVPPELLLEEIRALVYRLPGGGGSDDYLEMLEELVGAGILSWEQVEALEEAGVG